MSAFPRIIGLVGHPLHGKSTAQGFLSHLGIEALDDAYELRRRVCDEFGLTWRQVTTQEGKLEIVEAWGERMTVRKLLGDYGQIYEREHGPNYWVDIALEKIRGTETPVSFGSLRRSQGSAVKACGGLIVEIYNPNKDESEHEFDQYDLRLVDVSVMNDGTLEEFKWNLLSEISPYMAGQM